MSFLLCFFAKASPEISGLALAKNRFADLDLL